MKTLTRLFVIAGIAAIFGLTLPLTVHAFEIKTTDDGLPIHWEQDEVSYYMHARGGDDISLDEAENAVRASFDQWNDHEGVELRFNYAGITQEAEYGFHRDRENINSIVWEEEAWPFDSSALAVTLTTFSTRTGNLLDADIIVNGQSFTWRTDGSEKYHDLANSMTHEVGHFLGLDHSDARDATMYPSAPTGETDKRDLAQDDLQGLYFLYGNGDAPPEFEIFNPDTALPAVQSEDSGVRINDAQVHLSCSTAASPSAPGKGTLWGLGLMAMVALGATRRKKVTMRSKSIVATLLGLSLVLAVPATSFATELPELDLEALSTRSDHIIMGRVLHTQVQARRGILWTSTTVEVESCLRQNDCAQGETMVVVTPGGELDGIGQHISGVSPMPQGQRVVLFLEQFSAEAHRMFRPVGMAQGTMRVQTLGQTLCAMRDLEGLHLRTEQGMVHGDERNQALPIEELRTMLSTMR